MDMIITPYHGVGDIHFSMNINDIRNILKSKYRHRVKKEISDAYDDLGIYVYFEKESMLCEAIEFAVPSNPTFSNTSMLGKPFKSIKDLFDTLDDNLILEDAGFTSNKYGIGVYAPHLKSDINDLIESVIVFRKGYYD